MPHIHAHLAGPMALTPDSVRVSDGAPELPGVWVGGGFCGHGMPFGPRVSQMFAEAAPSGATPEALAPRRLIRSSGVP